MGASTKGQTKAELRAGRLVARDALSPDERSARSAAIVRHGLAALSPAPGTVVSGYFAIRSEADILPLLTGLAERGARLALPAILDRETIVFRLWDPVHPLVETGWGTMGAAADAPPVDPDIILMPLAAFDAAGNRIGYGAGHYDRAIARMRERDRVPRLIGVAFACQEVGEVPAGPFDVPMAAVVTEEGFRTLPAGD